MRWIAAIAVLAYAPAADADAVKVRAKQKAKSKSSSNVFARRIEAKRVYDGLPPGFTWPPTRAMGEISRTCEAELDKLGLQWKPAAPLGRIVDPIVITD